MNKIISILICMIATCTCHTGCGNGPPITASLNGGVNLSESTEKITVSELENKLREATLGNSDKPLFESVTITENKGIFYNSYRFIGTIAPQETNQALILTLTMPGTPSGVKNGVIDKKQVIFPLAELSETIELVAEYEENNIVVMAGIIAALIVTLAAFLFFILRGNGSGYGHD